MEVILLENIGKLGAIGDVVSVKNGYGRNYLVPQGKALRATKENKDKFEAIRSEIEKIMKKVRKKLKLYLLLLKESSSL